MKWQGQEPCMVLRLHLTARQRPSPVLAEKINCALSPNLHALCNPPTEVPTKVLPLLLNTQGNRSLWLCWQQLPPTTQTIQGPRFQLGFSSSTSRTPTNATSSIMEQRELKTTTNHNTHNQGKNYFPAYSVQTFLFKLSPRILPGFCADEHRHHLLSLSHCISNTQTGLLDQTWREWVNKEFLLSFSIQPDTSINKASLQNPYAQT